MRRLAVALLRWLAEELVRLYYPRRSVEGAAHIPPRGPTLYVANHPNGLLDPLVLRVISGRPIRFLAKSTLWGNPFGRLAMDAFQCLPVYRLQDARAGGGERAVVRNEKTFARCRAELAAGAELALYPEGTSHSEPYLKPLKSGAARIALSSAAAATASPSGVPPLLIPVGSHYEDKSRFRSGVHLVIGPPIALDDCVREFALNQRQAISALTERIRARLSGLVLQAETSELLAGIARVASWTATDHADDSPERRQARTRELLGAYARLKAQDPTRLEQVAEAARRYARTLERLGVRDPWTLEAPRLSLWGVGLAVVRALVILLPAAWGLVTSWLPFRASGMAAERLTRDEDVLSTIKMIVGAAFLAGAWLIEAGLVGWLCGAPWGLLALLVAPAAGYAALRLSETLGDVGEAVRHLGWRSHQATVQRLKERRLRLAQDVTRALRQADQ